MSDDRREHLQVIPTGRGQVPAFGQAPPYYMQQPAMVFAEGAEQQQDVGLPLRHYLWVIRRHLWKIVAFVVVVVIATATVSLRMTPIYESTATLYIDRQEAKAVVGRESQSAPSYDTENFLASQVRLLQADSVVRPIVQRYNLLEKEQQINKDKDDPERQAKTKDAPMVLRNLKIMRPPNTSLLQVAYRSPDPQLAADVANGVAQSYIEHTYLIGIKSNANVAKFMEKQMEEMRAKVEISSLRLASLEREMGVINPEEKTNILSSRLMQLNTEYTKAQSERMRSEAAYNNMRNGSLDAAMVSSQSEELKRLTQRMNEANERFVEVKVHFGAAHPEYKKAQATLRELQAQVEGLRQGIVKRVENEFQKTRDQETMLQQSVAATKAEADRLGSRAVEYQRAKREAEADKNLYEELVKKIREAGINAGFQNNTVRVADSARPNWVPVSPRIVLNIALAFLFSTLLALGAAIMGDAMDTTIRDPEDATRVLNTNVIGSLPEVKQRKDLILSASSFRKLLPGAEASTSVGNGASKGAERRLSTYDEAVRTVRNSIMLTDFDRRIRTLLLTSATAGEGKSTIAGHVALAHAEQKNKTLLIDCDLRRPSQHRVFGMPQGIGLSNVLNGEMTWREALIRLSDDVSLDVILAGPPSRRAADQIGQLMGDIIEQMSKEYDLIVLDGPPLLGFPESLQLASTADGVVVVTRAGETNRKAVAATLSTLQHLRAKVIGLVLNQVKKHHSDHYYYYGYYGKYYKNYYEARSGE